MSAATLHRFALRFRAFAQIDAGAGIIRGVSVATIGPAKGHGMQLDATTLEQVKACAEQYSGGLKVKMTHKGDAGDIVGYLTGFRIEGDKLLADLHLLETSPQRAYILELAAKIPDTFGLSIAFSGVAEVKDEAVFARCAEIYSADLVSEPAANPTGLFDVGPLCNGTPTTDAPTANPNQFKMTPDEIKSAVNSAVECAVKAAIEPLSARLAKLETPPAADPAKDEAAMNAKIANAAELAAQGAMKLFAEKFGTVPAAVSAPVIAAPVQAEKKFEELVADKAKECGSKIEAINWSVKNHPAAHKAYLARVNAGEVITL